MNYDHSYEAYRKPGTRYYTFKDREKAYKVMVTELPGAALQYTAYVYFERETSNVFGNGSRWVWQAGWRRLPDGPKKRVLIAMTDMVRGGECAA